jgi:hypothetical protein
MKISYRIFIQCVIFNRLVHYYLFSWSKLIDDLNSHEEDSFCILTPINRSTLDPFFEVTNIHEQKSPKKDSFGMRSPTSWSTRDLFFEVTKINGQKSYKKDSFCMRSAIGWSTLVLFFEAININEYKFDQNDSFELWSSIIWSTADCKPARKKKHERNGLKNIHVVRDVG